MVWKSKFNGVFGAGFQKRGASEQTERHQFSSVIHGLSVYNGAVYRPHRARDEKSINRIISDGLYSRAESPGGGSTELYARNFPLAAIIGGKAIPGYNCGKSINCDEQTGGLNHFLTLGTTFVCSIMTNAFIYAATSPKDGHVPV
jgi:hypothetical protein